MNRSFNLIRLFAFLMVILKVDNTFANQCLDLFLADKPQAVISSTYSHPAPEQQNKWVYPSVRNLDNSRSFPQVEVLYVNLHPQIKEWVQKAIKDSVEGPNNNGQEREVGFFVIVGTDGQMRIEPVTSNNYDFIFTADINRAIDQVLKNSKNLNIQRVQFYHTHPKNQIMGRSISQGDMSEAMRLQEMVRSITGQNVPFDMHAMPLDFAFNGTVEYAMEQFPIVPTLLRATVEPP